MVTDNISKHIGAFAMAATSISNLSQEGIIDSYDVTAGRSYSKEPGMGVNNDRTFGLS